MRQKSDSLIRMGRITSFWETVRNRAKVDSFDYAKPGEAYSYIYNCHRDEAFAACIRYIRSVDPEAQLVYMGQDLGGPIWEVR